MNSQIKSGVRLLIFLAVLAIIFNVVGFGIYNSVLSTTVVNTAALSQMSDDAISNTAGRLAAEGKGYYLVATGFNTLLGLVSIIGFIRLYKGFKAQMSNNNQEGK